MDILNITFTESGNQATLRTDRGYFDMTRADLMEFLQKFLGEDVRSAVRPGAELDFLPLFVDDEAEGEENQAHRGAGSADDRLPDRSEHWPLG